MKYTVDIERTVRQIRTFEIEAEDETQAANLAKASASRYKWSDGDIVMDGGKEYYVNWVGVL